MDLQHELEFGGDPASWVAAIHPPKQVKYDNRGYLVAAYRGCAESGNGPIEAPQPPEEQPVPVAYAGGYR